MTVVRYVSLFLIGFALQGSSSQWPRVQPFALRFPIDLQSERVVVDVPLEDPAGTTLYHLACRGGAESYLDALPGNWVGPLECTLAEGTEASEESLLSEDDSAAWFSRGQFRREDLAGDCARYPEFGAHRSFRLRGFRLSLDAEDVRTDSHGLPQSFVLAVSVAEDPEAHTPRADRPGFLDPHRAGGSCSVISRGREPLMCRNETGSWVACSPASASMTVIVEFSKDDSVQTRVSAEELGPLTGQKLPYVLGTWIRAALHKLELPFVEAPGAADSAGRRIVSIRGVGGDASGRWVYLVDGVRPSAPSDAQLSDSARVVRLVFERGPR